MTLTRIPSRLLALIVTGVMLVVYVVVFIPLGLLRQAILPDPLHRKFNRQTGSYWQSARGR